MTLLSNRYCLIRELGVGGFGKTFLAEDTHMPSRRCCVIKQLKPITNNPQIYQLIQERFQREAAILEELGGKSDQIPKLYGYFSEAGQFYLVQEWIEGKTLSHKVQHEGLCSESLVKEILENILPVLDYVHSKRIVHRDIKPDNIILRDWDSKPVLIDFGAVRETMATLVSQTNNTKSIVIGTPGFMPSEQASGRPVYASDLYSLGLTAIYLLTGKLPQQLETEPQTGEIIWQQYATSVSSQLRAVLERVIQPQARDRYPTAKAMLDAMQPSPAIPSTLTSPTPPPQAIELTPPPPIQRSRNIPIGSLFIGGLVAASVIVGFLLTKSPTPVAQTPPTPTEKQQPIETPSLTPTPEASQLTTLPPLTQPTSAVGSNNLDTTAVVTPNPTLAQDKDYSWLAYKSVTDADLVGKSAFELDIIRNSIFARHGRQFVNQELQNYFNNQPWYRPIYSPKEFPNNLLSDLERKNAAYILQYQNQNGLRWAR